MTAIRFLTRGQASRSSDGRTLAVPIVISILVTLVGVPTGQTHLNDTFVSIDSALGTGSLDEKTFFTLPLTGANARNHASIADADVARQVREWIIAQERETGDLR